MHLVLKLPAATRKAKFMALEKLMLHLIVSLIHEKIPRGALLDHHDIMLPKLEQFVFSASLKMRISDP